MNTRNRLAALVALALVVTLGLMWGIAGSAQAALVLDYQASLDTTPGNDTWENLQGIAAHDWALSGAPRVAADGGAFDITHAYQFDGSTIATTETFETIDGTGYSQGPASFEFLFKVGDFTGKEMIFESGGGTDGSALFLDGSMLNWKAKDNTPFLTGQFDLSTLSPDEQGDFIHLVTTIDLANDEVLLYVNSVSGTPATGSNINDWCGNNDSGMAGVNGAACEGGTSNFTGEVSLLRFYDSVLGAGEVEDLYAALLVPMGMTWDGATANWDELFGDPLHSHWSPDSTQLPDATVDATVAAGTATVVNQQYANVLTIEGGDPTGGAVVIGGTGDLDVTAEINVGPVVGAGNSGALTVNAGGALSAAMLSTEGAVSFDLAGGTSIDIDEIELADGSFTVSNGHFTANDLVLVGGVLDLGGNDLIVTGNLILEGGYHLDMVTDPNLGNLDPSGAEVTLNAGTTLTIDNDIQAQALNLAGGGLVHSNNNITVTGSLDLSGSSNLDMGTGQLIASGAALTVNTDSTLTVSQAIEAAELNLAGGGLVHSNNNITVTGGLALSGGSNLDMGTGDLTANGAAISVADAGTLTVDNAVTAQSITVAGATAAVTENGSYAAGDFFLSDTNVDFDIGGSANVTAQGGIVNLNGLPGGDQTYTGATFATAGTLNINDPVTQTASLSVDGATVVINQPLTTTGASVMVPGQLDYGFYQDADIANLSGIDDGVVNQHNGGLFDLTPDPSSIWTGEVWQGGNIDDTYCQMWSGYFKAPATGTYEFYVHGDDYEILWIDQNQNGDFEANGIEDVSVNVPPEGWDTPHTETIDLTEGEVYAFAAAHTEEGGGDYFNLTIKEPGGTAVRVNPSIQTDWWFTGLAFDGAQVSNGTLDINATLTTGAVVVHSGGVVDADALVVSPVVMVNAGGIYNANVAGSVGSDGAMVTVNPDGRLNVTHADALNNGVDTAVDVTLNASGLLDLQTPLNATGAIDVKAYGVLMGNLAGLDYDTKVTFEENAALAPDPVVALDLPTRTQLGDQAKLLLGVADATLQVKPGEPITGLGEDNQPGTIFKGALIGFFSPDTLDNQLTLSSNPGVQLDILVDRQVTLDGPWFNSAQDVTNITVNSGKQVILGANSIASNNPDPQTVNVAGDPAVDMADQTILMLPADGSIRGGTDPGDFTVGIDNGRAETGHDNAIKGTIHVGSTGGLNLVSNLSHLGINPNTQIELADGAALRIDNPTRLEGLGPAQITTTGSPILVLDFNGQNVNTTDDVALIDLMKRCNVFLGDNRNTTNAGDWGVLLGDGMYLVSRTGGQTRVNTGLTKLGVAEPNQGHTIGFAAFNGQNLVLNEPVVATGSDIIVGSQTEMTTLTNVNNFTRFTEIPSGNVQFNGAVDADNVIIKSGTARFNDPDSVGNALNIVADAGRLLLVSANWNLSDATITTQNTGYVQVNDYAAGVSQIGTLIINNRDGFTFQGGESAEIVTKLTGSGNVRTGNNGTLIMLAGSELAPGASVGTLGVHHFTMQGGSTYTWEMGPTENDLVDAAADGNLTLNDTWNLALLNLDGGARETDQFTLFTYGGTGTVGLANIDDTDPSFALWDTTAKAVVHDTVSKRVYVTGLKSPELISEDNTAWSHQDTWTAWMGDDAFTPQTSTCTIVNHDVFVAAVDQHAYRVDVVSGSLDVQGGAQLSVGNTVEVAAGRTLNVDGELNAYTVNTAGTTAFGAGSSGTIDNLNVTGGLTTLSTPTIGNMTVESGGTAVVNAALSTTGDVTVYGNLNANASVHAGGVMKLDDGTVTSAGTVAISGEEMRIRNTPDLVVDSGQLTIDCPAGPPILGIDIGNPGVAGSFSEVDDTYTVRGGGSDIWLAADHFHFVYQPFSGDGEMIGRVHSIEQTNTWAKGGIMIRELLTDTSKNAFVAWTPPGGENRITFQRRDTDGGASASEHVAGFTTPPYWLKIVREGDTFSGYWANDVDGSPGAWTQRGNSQTVSMNTDVYIGLAVTAHDDAQLCTAVFDNVGFRFGTVFGDLTMQPDTHLVLADAGAAGFEKIITTGNATITGGVTLLSELPRGGNPGVLTIDGDFTMATGATYKWDADADLVAVGGDLVLEDGWGLLLEDVVGPPVLGEAYSLFTYATLGGVSGQSGMITNVVIEDPPTWDESIVRYGPKDGGGEHVFLFPVPTLVWDQTEDLWGSDHWTGQSPQGFENMQVGGGKVTVAGDYTGGSAALALAITGGLVQVDGGLEMIRDVAVAGGGLNVDGNLAAANVGITGTGSVQVQLGGQLNVGSVDVADTASLSVAGELNTAALNTAGTTNLSGSGVIDNLNVTGGVTTVATPTIGNLNVASAGTVVVGGSIDATQSVTVAGNLIANDAEVKSTAGTMTLDGCTLTTSGTVAVGAAAMNIINMPDINVTSGHLTIDSPPTAPAGAAGYWALGEGPGAATAIDGSGNDRDGTVFGATSGQPGPVGTAYTFDGTDDYVNIDGYKGITGSDPRTMAAWVRTTKDDASLLSWGINQATEKWHFRVQTGNGTPGAIRVENNGGRIVGDTDIRDDQWHHVAAVLPEGATNINQVLLYLDGQLETISDVLGNTINTAGTDDVRIATDHQGRYWRGGIDEVYIYPFALDLNGIRAVMNARSTGFGDLTIAAGAELTLADSGAASFNSITAGDGATINGNVTMLDELNLGTSPAQLNVLGDFVLGANTTFNWDDPGDKVVVSGDLDARADWNVHVTLGWPPASGDFTLFESGNLVGLYPDVGIASDPGDPYAELIDFGSSDVSAAGDNVVLHLEGVGYEEWISQADNDWGTGGNWQSGNAPTSDTAAVVFGDPKVPAVVSTAPQAAHTLIIDNGGAVQVTGAGELSVANNAHVLAGTTLSADGGTLAVEGDLNTAGTTNFGGTAAVTITGALNSSGPTTIGGTATVGATQASVSADELKVDPGAALSVTGDLNVGAAGSLTVAGGATLNADAVTTAGDTTFAAGSLGNVNEFVITGGTASISSPTIGAVVATGGILDTAASVGELIVEGGAVNVTAAVSADLVSVASGSLSLTSPAAGNLTAQEMAITGGTVDTGTNQVEITDSLEIGPLDVANRPYNITGGTFTVEGSDLLANVDKLTLKGGTLTVGSPPLALTGQDISLAVPFPGIPGSYAFDPGSLVHTVEGSGRDIWNADDEFHYASMPISGDVDVEALVESITLEQGTGQDTWNKAGPMIRELIDPVSKYGLSAMTHTQGFSFQGREDVTPNNTLFNEQEPGVDKPYWVRLVRQGDTFTGYRKANAGDPWIQQGNPHTIAMDADVYVGLAVTSHDNTALVQAVISNVTINGVPFGPRSLDLPNTDLEVTATATFDTPAEEVVLRDLTVTNPDPPADPTTLTLSSAFYSFNNVTGDDGATIAGNFAVLGNLSPGGSVGVLNVNGELELAEATYLCEIDSTGADLVKNLHMDEPIILSEATTGAALTLLVLESLGAPGCYTDVIVATSGTGEIEGDFDVNQRPAEGDHLDYGVFLDGYQIVDTGAGFNYNLNLFQAEVGDTDGDGDVDLDDLSALDDGWGPTATDRIWKQGDFDLDGDVDLDDLSALDDKWSPAGYPVVNCPFGGGGAGAGAAAVPEPGTFALLAMGLVALLLWRRYRRRAV